VKTAEIKFCGGLLRADGSIVAWGNNWYGQCDPPAPNTGFVAIAAGGDHSLGLKAFRGDLNCDGTVDSDDINPFVRALLGRDVYGLAVRRGHWLNGDINGDGDVDFDDINPFVDCLMAGGCP
jgi:hypothetical protein